MYTIFVSFIFLMYGKQPQVYNKIFILIMVPYTKKTPKNLVILRIIKPKIHTKS